MIGQFLSNTNESATVLILQKILELNKAQAESASIVVTKPNVTITSFTCMESYSNYLYNKYEFSKY